MVAVLLLYGGRPQRVRAEASGRDEAGDPGCPQGGRVLRPGAGAGRPIARRQAIHGAGAVRVRSSDPAGSPVWEMARVRSGRHYSLLRLASARGRDDQVESAEDHRSRHGLALLQRAEEGVEGVITRRDFLYRLTAGTMRGALGVFPVGAAAEPTLETTTITLNQIPGICVAPQYVAEELFGREGVRSIRDLKGKTVAIPEFGSPHHVFTASMAAHVGLNPARDINFVIQPAEKSAQLLQDRKVDALMGFPPVPQELRSKNIGHVIVSSGADRPWSQYFGCIVGANQAFVRKHPVAPKRALRAILKAA